MVVRRWHFVLICGLIASEPALAADTSSSALKPIFECRALPDATARLACYDSKVAQLEADTSAKKVTIVSQDEIKQARRSLFGFSLPRLSLLDGKAKSDEPDVTEISSKIKQAFQRGDGQWTLVLEDGARWAQTDGMPLRFDAKPGDTVVIRRAALGSYLARIGGQTAIRMQRENR